MSSDSPSAYGARPASLDTVRGRALREGATAHSAVEGWTRRLPLTDDVVADRLALAHWPRGHQIVVCSLSGGTGRTTLTGLIGAVLAHLPYAHIWPPVAIVDAHPCRLSTTPHRWRVIANADDDAPGCTADGAWAFRRQLQTTERQSFSVAVVDAPPGLPSDLPLVAADPTASLVLVIRPDRAALAEAANALVWMHDRELVSRSRITVVVNDGIGRTDNGARSAAVALGIRCAAVHRLPDDPALAPGLCLPSGRDLPVRLRRRIARICLNAWASSQPPRPPLAPVSK